MSRVLERRAHRRVGRQRVRVEPARDRAQPEARPADQQPDPAAAAEVAQHVQRMLAEVGDAERLVRLDEVQPVMRDPRALRRR